MPVYTAIIVDYSVLISAHWAVQRSAQMHRTNATKQTLLQTAVKRVREYDELMWQVNTAVIALLQQLLPWWSHDYSYSNSKSSLQ